LLDVTESESGVLASQCLDRRIADKQILAREVTAWQNHRNNRPAIMTTFLDCPGAGTRRSAACALRSLSRKP
jgi:hypothetical protein